LNSPRAVFFSATICRHTRSPQSGLTIWAHPSLGVLAHLCRNSPQSSWNQTSLWCEK